MYNRNGFDQAIRRPRFNPQSRRQSLDALAVDGVDVDHRRQAQARQHAAGLDMHGMGRAVLDRHRLGVVFTMIDKGSDFMNFLMQATAKGYVHFLETAADPQHRDACLDGGADQRQGGGIACRIMSSARRTGRAMVVKRFYIGRRAGKENTVQGVQNNGRGEQIRQGRNQHGQALGGCRDSPGIFIAADVIRMQAQLPGAGGDAD
ncbi:hypothetical protein BK652_15495 [Pseudomonas brassicacearum]|uniref:Uncharacterized protein n=3 Tax=Pseudomonas TaxID=286 RepID=A0A0G3G9B3_9PSED|nr:hypothetical protein VM99_02900 [Pseudomonas chlororaphis]KIQ59914.1 hypothetical protein RL74_08200 [Pseudomonas fluorescens]ROM81910.1 hypothetical protein BK652_15495 [Pseudomonas brassicacearum]